jgi:hypothetical protein
MSSALKMLAVYSSETVVHLPTTPHGLTTQKTNIDIEPQILYFSLYYKTSTSTREVH